MAQKNWLEVLGWGENELSDMRFVAYSYIRQGIYDVALKIFDALTILSVPTAYDLQTLGAIHLQLGNGLKALEHLDRALKLEPNHLLTQLNRAKALFMLGYKKQGMSAAIQLEKQSDESISSQAKALLLTYS